MNFFHPSSLVGRAVLALFYGVCVFVVIYIIGIILTQIGQLAEVGTFLEKFAPILGVLAGLAAFFTGIKPVA